MSILNIGMIGVGSRAKAHLKTIPKLSDKYKLVAVCGLGPERAGRIGKEMGVNAYTDLEEMLDKEQLDVGLISVQAEGHQVITQYLADRKIHIISETPIALTLPCIDMMIHAAQRNGVFLDVAENVGRWPHERLKQKIVASGLIGDVTSFYLSYRMGTYHGLNAIRMITGREAVEVSADFIGDAEVVERAKICMEGGIQGIYENKTSGGKYWDIQGTKGSLKNQTLYLDGQDEGIEIITETLGEDDRKTIQRTFVATSPEWSWENPHRQYSLPRPDDVACAETLVSMYNAIVHGQPPTYDGHQARKDMELLLAIRESATQGGASVKLPLTELTEHERRLHAEFEKAYGVDCLTVEPRHLKLRYALPQGLKDFLYIGRLAEEATA